MKFKHFLILLAWVFGLVLCATLVIVVSLATNLEDHVNSNHRTWVLILVPLAALLILSVALVLSGGKKK